MRTVHSAMLWCTFFLRELTFGLCPNKPRCTFEHLMFFAIKRTLRPRVPLLLTAAFDTIRPGGTDKNLCRCFGAPACRVFPDHLITFLYYE